MGRRTRLALLCLVAALLTAARCERYKVSYAPGAGGKVGAGFSAWRRLVRP
jgi:hypothetical protein